MDRLQSLQAFVAVVEAGSLTAAADQLDITSQMVGKHLRALEERLGLSLITRSTRRQSLTEAGRGYYERCRVILDELQRADEQVEAHAEVPRGRLRITAPVTFGTCSVAPAMAEYLARYPELRVELILNNHVVDLIEDGFDVALRVGPLPDSRLMARPLAPYEMAICAAPRYLKRAGTPRSAADLASHVCLGFTHWRHRGGWRLGRPDDNPELPPSRLVCNHGPALMLAAVQGLGLVMLPRVLVAGELAAGRLVELLKAELQPPQPLHVVCTRGALGLPKVRSFVDFMVERFGPPSPPRTGRPLARTPTRKPASPARRRV
jgi:DNA-binding transcriptional LysR family regulator